VLPRIVGIPSEVSYTDASGNQCIVVPEDIDCVVVDAPAGLPEHQLIDYTCGAHAIFVPVLPSDLDVHAASRLISSLLLRAQVSRRNQRLCVVPNRVRERTIAYQQLCRFLNRLSIDVVGVVRDSQNYVWAAKNGTCIHEMTPCRVSKEMEHWASISGWLERRLATPLTSRDLLRPREATQKRQRKRLRLVQQVSLAAAVGLIAVPGQPEGCRGFTVHGSPERR
jgi:chromosome partitioning protein